MKLKLLVVLMALISFSSCKKEETSSLELDKSNLITLSGKVDFFLDYGLTIPGGSEVTIVVANSIYNPSATGEQFFSTPINADGTYSYELALPIKSSASIDVDLVLPNIISEEGIVYGTTKQIKITLGDMEMKNHVYYHLLKDADDVKYSTLEGVVTIEEGYNVSLPADTKIIATIGKDFKEFPVNADGKYKTELPVGRYELTLPKFQSDNGFQFEGSGLVTIEELVPNYKDLTYIIASSESINGYIESTNSEVLPASMEVSILAENGNKYFVTIDNSDDLSSSINYTIFYPNNTNVSSKDLLITPTSFVGEDTNTYYAELNSKNFKYTPHTPSVELNNVSFNGTTIPVGESVTISLEDPNNPISEVVTATVEYDQNYGNIVKFVVPETFYIKGGSERNINFNITYNDGISNYLDSSTLDMNSSKVDTYYLNLMPITPIITATTVSYDDRIKSSILLPEGAQVSIELKDDFYSITETITASIDENNELKFQVPASFYKENNKDRYISTVIKYTLNNVDYVYSSSVWMYHNNEIGNIILEPNTPTVKYSNLYLITNGVAGNPIRSVFSIGQSIEVRLFDDDNNLYSSINVVIENDGISFVVPSKFLIEGNNNRNIRPVIVGYHEGSIAFGLMGGSTNGNVGDSVYNTYDLEIQMDRDRTNDANVFLVN